MDGPQITKNCSYYFVATLFGRFKNSSYIRKNKIIHYMKRILSFVALMGMVITSCTNNFKPKPPKIDTVLIAYQEQGAGWRLNRAIREQKMGHKFVTDSGLEAKWEYITTFRLAAPPLKVDSIIDSATHKLLGINPRYFPTPLPDTLNHYIHILDSTK